jgi:glutathione S-transferase
MKLFYAETINPRKACAVAQFVRAPVDFVFVDLGKGEHQTEQFRQMNPNRKVPVLVEPGKTLWEANAIMCRLSEAMGSSLWPSGERQIEVVRWLSWDAAHFTRFGGTLYFENMIRPHIGLGPPDEDAVSEATEGFRHFAKILDDHLGTSAWTVGDCPTVADFALGASLPFATPAGIPVAEFRNVTRWYEGLSQLEGWMNPFPAR